MDISALNITPEMVGLIGEIDEFKGAWQLFGRLAPERLNALKTAATIESVGSSTRIEGAKLSDREVEALLMRIETHTFKSRDEQEVAGYAFVCEQIFSAFESIPLTENTIKQLHQGLLQYSEKDQRHPGEYKKLSNDVQAFDENGKSVGIVFETTSPFETPLKMQELIYWTREALEVGTFHPLFIVGAFVVIFLAIHPFQDGNGRLSRCLTTLLLLKCGYRYVPYTSLESVIEENKDSYYIALRRTQQSLKSDHPDYTPWLLFFLRALQKQKRRLEQKISRESVMSLCLPELSVQIMQLIADHTRLSIGELEVLTKANRNTIKKHVQDLTTNALLLRHGKGRSTWYTVA